MAAVTTMVALAGLALAAYGTYQQGEAVEAQDKSSALFADYQAKQDEANAAVTNLQASANEESQRREARRRLGAMRGEIAQSGTGLLGSNADIYSQSARDAELDALNIRYGGLMESKGLLNQSDASRYNSAGYLAEARAGKQAANLRTGTMLLTGGANIYNTYSKPPQTSAATSSGTIGPRM